MTQNSPQPGMASAAVPRVSVLMAVYNERPDFLEQAMASILAQTLADFEFVVLDDGSSNGPTIARLKLFAEQDARIRLFLEPHRGLARTLNAGLSLCRAPLVCRQDSDDWSAPPRLERQFQFMHHHPDLAVSGTFAHLHQEDGRPLWPVALPATRTAVHHALPAGNPFFHGSLCFRREAARGIGGYRDLAAAEDYDFVWRLSDEFGGANLPDVLYHHRRTAGSISTLQAGQQLRDKTIVQILGRMRRAGQREDLSAAFREAEAAAQEDGTPGVLRHADQLLLAGHYRRALVSNLKAVVAAPLSATVYGKLARCLAFPLVPPFRHRLFRATAVAAA